MPGIPDRAREFTVQGMDTRSGEKLDVLGTHSCMLFYLCNIFNRIVKIFYLIC